MTSTTTRELSPLTKWMIAAGSDPATRPFRVVLFSMMSRASWTTLTFFQTIDELIEHTGLSKSGVINQINAAVASGWLERIEQGNSKHATTYRLLPGTGQPRPRRKARKQRSTTDPSSWWQSNTHTNTGRLHGLHVKPIAGAFREWAINSGREFSDLDSTFGEVLRYMGEDGDCPLGLDDIGLEGLGEVIANLDDRIYTHTVDSAPDSGATADEIASPVTVDNGDLFGPAIPCSGMSSPDPADSAPVVDAQPALPEPVRHDVNADNKVHEVIQDDPGTSIDHVDPRAVLDEARRRRREHGDIWHPGAWQSTITDRNQCQAAYGIKDDELRSRVGIWAGRTARSHTWQQDIHQLVWEGRIDHLPGIEQYLPPRQDTMELTA